MTIRKLKIISIFIFFCIITSTLILSNNVKGESLVDPSTIQTWTNAYISEYIKTIENNFTKDYGDFFTFYGKHPFKIKSVISRTHGAAIEMISTTNYSEMTFENIYTDDKIEIAVFVNNIFNNTIFNISAFDYMREIPKNDLVLFPCGSNIIFSQLQVLTRNGLNNVNFVDIHNYGDALFSDIIVDGIYFNYTYIKGSNDFNNWSIDNANKTALYHLTVDIQNAFLNALNSQEFKDYLEYEDLEKKLYDIKAKIEKKRDNSSYQYTYYDFDFDIKNVENTAHNEYGMSNDFLQRIIDFVGIDYTLPANNSTTTQTNNDLFDILSLFFITFFIFGFIGVLYKYKDKDKIMITILIAFLLAIFGFLLTVYVNIPLTELDIIKLISSSLSIFLIFIFFKIRIKFIEKIKRKYRFKKYIKEIKKGNRPTITSSDFEYFLENYNSEEIKRIKDRKKLKKFIEKEYKGD